MSQSGSPDESKLDGLIEALRGEFPDVEFGEFDEDDDDLPNPLFVTGGILPPDAREHLLATDDGRVIIDYPPDDQTGLEVLTPLFDVIRSVQLSYGVTDLSLLDQIPHLEELSLDENSAIVWPTACEWPRLQGYAGPWHAGAAQFLSAPKMESVQLRRATQEALDLLTRPLDYLGLQRPQLVKGSTGSPVPAAAVSIDTAKSIDVGNFGLLTMADIVNFESIGTVEGLEMASADRPFRELTLENIRSLGATNPWHIRGDLIVAEGEPNVMKWVQAAWPSKPVDWKRNWAFGDRLLPKDA